jgi:hypothetical protein
MSIELGIKRRLRRIPTTQSVTLIILAHGRSQRLIEALNSVSQQDCDFPLRVLLFGDNAPYVNEIARSFDGMLTIDSLSIDGWISKPDKSLFERVARLRNMALNLVETPLVCFLDDDNIWEKQHVSSLVEAMHTSGAPVAHSWRRLIREDDSEWIPNDFPWLPSGPESKALFKIYLTHGVFNERESIVRDVASLSVDGVDIGMVDLGEWMFDSILFELMSFDPIITQSDLAGRVGEDDKLLRRFHTFGIPIACSELPTLIYRLGGFSNACEIDGGKSGVA